MHTENITSRVTHRASWVVRAGETLPLPRVFLPEQRSLLTLDGPEHLLATLRTSNIDRTMGGAVVLNSLRDVDVGRDCWIGLAVTNQGATDASFSATVQTA